ncbi:MAG: FAD-binding oxidoreductase [Gammaproteobacteria bacterium]|nr:FAD-binding oxidoreductase [Gammaproteobacteria bacterium]
MSEPVPVDLVAQTWERALKAPAKIPASADVVIIGGGIVGVCTAWFLAKQGVNVTLCEKGHIAGEQSGRNWGWVRVQARDTREMPMIIDSLNIWRGLADEIGEDVGYVQTGTLFAASSDAQLEKFSAWLKVADEYGIDTRILSPEDLAQHVRGHAVTWRGAMYTATDARAEPHKATTAIARAAARKGATVLSACAVRGIETAGGRVSAVVTEHGRIRTSVVLCAAGAWSSMFCRALGVSVPQLKVRGTVVRTSGGDDVLDGNLFDDHLGIRRRQDGGYTIAHGTMLDHPITPATFRFAFKFLPALMQEHKGLRLSIGREFLDEWRTPKTWALDDISPFEKTRVLNPAPNPKVVRGIRQNMKRVFPGLASAQIVEAWAGMVETSPDVVPMIEQIASIPGFHVATGFSGHGFGIGPGAGRALAGLLTGSDTGIDLTPFRLSRFFDGTPIRPQASV